MAIDIKAIAADYAKAWCSGSPEAVASFYAPDGAIAINAGEPHVGRPAIEAMAAGFYNDFPDLVVHCDDARLATANHAIFVWTLEGHHAQTKAFVKVGGWEEWDLDANGKVTFSRGWFDGDEYARQVGET